MSVPFDNYSIIMADNILEIKNVYDIPPDIRKQYDNLSGPSATEHGINEIKVDLKDIKKDLKDVKIMMADLKGESKMNDYIKNYYVAINYLEIEQDFNKQQYITHASELGKYIFPQWESKNLNTRQPDAVECFSLLTNRLKSSIVQKFEFEPDDTLGSINNENTSDPEIFSYVCNKLNLLKPGIYELNDPKTVNPEHAVRAKIKYQEDIDYADLLAEQEWIKKTNFKNEKRRMGIIQSIKATVKGIRNKRFIHQSKDGKVVFYINDGEYEIIPVKHTNSFSPFVDQTVKILFQHYKSFLNTAPNMNLDSKRKLIILKKSVTLQDKINSFKKCIADTEEFKQFEEKYVGLNNGHGHWATVMPRISFSD
ncbi:10480_t:CDS:2 [Racocetra persica]|uniref:10480_t:CDS:1 n=1 Tax=Racocetra persica TaxID=160502 RepID=A0ACA9Q1H3_9GLOM|nr:10480_t:CDS:2 [Racocetra persica]